MGVAPIVIDKLTDPSIVEFPISIVAAPGQTGNGVYRDAIMGAGITSEGGAKLSSPYADQFNIQDLNGPRVALTTYFGRIVTLAFNEPLNPATVTPANIFVVRAGGVGNPLLGPNAILVSDLPGATFFYNPINFTVTINLTGVPQSSLPTDHYGLVVTNAVTDLLNNPLNGAFSGVFPSGTTPEGLGGSVFFQDLGLVNLQAPIISALTLSPTSDTGVSGDNNTADNTPSVVGQVTAKFPGTVSGLLVYAEFNGINHTGVGVPIGGLDLGLGQSGRGFLGHYDVQAVTNSLGQFVINYPPGVAPLPDGLNQVRVVVVGAPDLPPLPGLSSVQNTSFRVDTTDPFVGPPETGGPATSVVNGENLNSLSSLTLNFVDGVNPQGIGSPFAVPATFNVPALDPITADNVNSYGLFLVNAAGQILKDESSFITSATFTSTSTRVLTSDPYTGSVSLAFAPGIRRRGATNSSPDPSGLRRITGLRRRGQPLLWRVPRHGELSHQLQPPAVADLHHQLRRLHPRREHGGRPRLDGPPGLLRVAGLRGHPQASKPRPPCSRSTSRTRSFPATTATTSSSPPRA